MFLSLISLRFLSLKIDVNVPVFRIRIRRIRIFFGLPDSQLDPLVRGTDPRIRIRANMSLIRNIGFFNFIFI
jgi:hypothetical protein